MPANQYPAFAVGVGADVLDPTDYGALPALSTGFQAGIADPAQLNTVWRLASVGVAALALIGVDAGQDMLDNGDPADFKSKLVTAITAIAVAAGGGLSPWLRKTANYAAVAGDRIEGYTAGGTFTVTLPASPTAGTEVWIKGNFLTNNLTVARNGHTINGSATNLVLNKDNITAILVYDATNGDWVV